MLSFILAKITIIYIYYISYALYRDYRWRSFKAINLWCEYAVRMHSKTRETRSAQKRKL